MMKKMNCVKKLAIATAALSFSGIINAGTIAFQGEVTDQTCNASVDGGADNTVLLNSVPASMLATATSTANVTPFTISLSGCTAPTTAAAQYKVYFLTNHADAATGALINTATANAATNVQLQLIENNAANNAVPGTATLSLDPGVLLMAGLVEVPVSSTTGSTTFAVQYYATAAATVGMVESSMTYVVRYE